MNKIDLLHSPEDKLRLAAFHAFYKLNADLGRDERFARAIVLSAGPIKDRKAMAAWVDGFCYNNGRSLEGGAK